MLVFLGTKRTAIRFLVTGFFVIMGAINGVVLSNRVTPFGFTDINMVGDLLTMQDSQYFSAQEAFLVILCLLAFLLILLRFTFSGTKTTPKHKLISRIAVVVLSFALLWPTTFVLQHTKILTSYFGNLAQGYLDYGYLYGFSTSMLIVESPSRLHTAIRLYRRLSHQTITVLPLLLLKMVLTSLSSFLNPILILPRRNSSPSQRTLFLIITCCSRISLQGILLCRSSARVPVTLNSRS